uniref:Uncharacterized protein n=1 Tax=Hyaloperonospora arabidopsidis (strain Emoy2) TaxID=559515 RepID=M4BZQ5_HYAAE
MDVKCPKKTNRWVHWGRVLNFYERYRRPKIARTEEKHPENLPWAKWWVSCTRWRPPSWRSTSRSLSCRANRCWCAAAGVVQCVDRHAHYHVLHRGRLSGREREDDGEAEYVSIGSVRIDVASIESHIRDQWSAAGEYCDRLEANDQKSVIKEIAMYAIMLVEGLMNVKAERDENNLPLDHNAPLVMPQQLVRLRPSKFILDVLNAYRDRLEIFWMP